MTELEYEARVFGMVVNAMFAPPDLPGERWCEECGIRTNHTTAQHRTVMDPDHPEYSNDDPTWVDVKPDEEPLDEQEEC